MLSWSKQFNIFCLLDNQNYSFEMPAFDWLAGAGAIKQISVETGNALKIADHFINEQHDILFGHLSYDLKNEIEKLESSNPDGLQFPILCFFCPEILIRASANGIEIGIFGNAHSAIFDSINSSEVLCYKTTTDVRVQHRFTREEYIETVNKLKDHIHRGDCYEINFCQEFFAEDVKLDPAGLYEGLMNVSPNPFSCFYKLND